MYIDLNDIDNEDNIDIDSDHRFGEVDIKEQFLLLKK
jgi:hypothetical protein